MADLCPPPQSPADAADPGKKSRRPKRDAAAQTGSDAAGASLDPGKRRREHKAHNAASELVKRPALDIQSPTGPMVIHINTQDYVVRPADLVAEPWVTEQQVRYIRKFITYASSGGPWFPIDRAPVPASWAIVRNNPRIMHRVHCNQPLFFWMVGSLVDIQLVGLQGAQLPTLHAFVKFLRACDRARAIDLHNSASSDIAREMAMLLAESPSSADEGPPAYDNVYDARFRFEGKSRMHKVNPARVLSGDIVLVECTLVRAEIAGGGTAASFVLNALYWLAEKPRPPAIPPSVAEFPDVITLDLS
ncbi:hypothetical protein OH76DRAFT_1479433 [Lentinus brumalis]|uniref:Uncharacterized protein n=1 Tax=Lentinus brumalis TaxID=2498619 RepID=A0A371DM81_9APHY|nr:hypothetical protein OH76DRAFT_1479433 [Polyporus brumalis]